MSAELRRWRCPSGRTLVEAPPGRTTGIPGGPLLKDRYYVVNGDLTLDSTYEARSYSLEDDLYETDYAVREGRLVCIESVTHRADPARETVRFEMNDLVELGLDQPPTESDLLPALEMCQTPKDRDNVRSTPSIPLSRLVEDPTLAEDLRKPAVEPHRALSILRDATRGDDIAAREIEEIAAALDKALAMASFQASHQSGD